MTILTTIRGMVIATVLVLVVSGAGCGTRDAEKPRRPLSLQISKTEGATSAEATLRCGGGNRGTGYLEGEAVTAACVTALMSDPVVDFLESGRLPEGKRCKPRGEVPPGARVSFAGEWVGGKIERRLTVTDTCTAALWTYLAPLLSPHTQPLRLSWESIEAS